MMEEEPDGSGGLGAAFAILFVVILALVALALLGAFLWGR